LTYAEICQSVAKLVKKYDERDPFRLCRLLGIELIFKPLGKEQDAVKGFYFENRRIRTITINSDLPKVIQKIIVAHELCHAIHHRKEGIAAFHEFSLFDQNSRMDTAVYGWLKFCISRIPIIRAHPIAISVYPEKSQ